MWVPDFSGHMYLSQIVTNSRQISKEIIKLCKGKRSLAPAFASTLRQGYLNSPDAFCSRKWTVDIILDFINFAPSREPEFVVETSMARIFDEISSEPLAPPFNPKVTRYRQVNFVGTIMNYITRERRRWPRSTSSMSCPDLTQAVLLNRHSRTL